MYRLSMLALAAGLSLPAAAFAPASAHVVTDPNQGVADGYFRAVLRVSHGCHGAATTALTVTLPDGLVTVRPQPKPGWTVETTTRPLPTPVDAGHGMTVTEATASIIWRGGPLPDGQFDEFGLMMKLPAAATTLWLPVVQACGGTEIRWSEIPAEGQAWGSLHAPAPFVRVAPKPPAPAPAR